MNKITLIGNLTHDPEIRSTQSGVSVCSFTIAVNRKFAQQGGEKITDFFLINAWRGLADTCATYLAKGRKVAVVGELQARTYKVKDGTTRVSLDVSAEDIEFLTPRSQANKSNHSEPVTSDVPSNGFTDVLSTDDIPF